MKRFFSPALFLLLVLTFSTTTYSTLQTTALEAGARVVASFWRIDDRATADIMRRFYEAMLKNGLTPAAALRAAQVSMLNDKRWQSPHFWAALRFRVSGGDKRHKRLKRGNLNAHLIIHFCAFCAFLWLNFAQAVGDQFSKFRVY